MDLRPYQIESIRAVNAFMTQVKDSNPCIVLPTGSGKTVVMAEMIKDYRTRWKPRICIIAHVKELIQQNSNKLHQYWPEMPLDEMGIYSAGLNQRDWLNPVIFAGIQSVYNKAIHLGRFDLILIDEAHRIPLKGEGMYRTFIDDAKRINPNLKIVGLTATDYRLQGGRICGPKNILNHVCYEANIKNLIKDGYLSPLVSRGSLAEADLSIVKIQNGDYKLDELEAAMNSDRLVEDAVREMIKFCHDRKAWIIFCVGVDHAYHVSNELEKKGIEAPVIHAKTPSKERANIIKNFSSGDLKALININVLSEGFDVPHVDAIIMLRPTKSAGLYYQQVGRGLRIHPGKKDCLVLDFANNIPEHGPIDNIQVAQKSGSSSQVVLKKCRECQSYCPGGCRICPECGHEFVVSPNEVTHESKASGVAILSSGEDKKYKRFEVSHVKYSKHHKVGKPPSMRVDYYGGLQRIASEFVCFEHRGFAQASALRWWKLREKVGGTSPTTVDKAIDMVMTESDGIKEPKSILIDSRAKYPEILNYEWVKTWGISS